MSRLGVVPTRGQRRIPNEFAHLGWGWCPRLKRPVALVGLLVVIEPRRILEQRIAAGCADASRCQQCQKLSAAQVWPRWRCIYDPAPFVYEQRRVGFT